ncbi:uncharacterized protein LOC131432721 [Malaya genurostris]|uniref:uncharacterized protein LOC131432721 n=1 Tax=Malaya genurostris TaxID=325434 RepID=UPI0026F39215|nr:uncharacterized protein LOC131432721 [Malaya genurostris]
MFAMNKIFFLFQIVSISLMVLVVCVNSDLTLPTEAWEPKSATELRDLIYTNIVRLKTTKEQNQLLKQDLSLPTNPIHGVTGLLTNGCQCINGLCSCCTGIFSMRGCINLTYIPEDFAFDFKMLVNNRVLYRNKITGRNPPPVCIAPPRLDFIEVCARFYDLYFFGRNMHVCLAMNGNFEGFELFSRQFNCLRMGDKGIKVIKPGEDTYLSSRPPGLEAEIDAGTDDIDDYDDAFI